MSYNDFVGVLDEPPENYIANLKLSKIGKKSRTSEYDFVRYGAPSGVVKHEKVKGDIELLIKHFITNGYSTWPSSKIQPAFRKHVALLRCSLDCWEEISESICMSKEEIYFRCLTEGPSFTDWVKKARSTTLRALTSETDTPIEEEYILKRYTGYDSMFNERFLIHWDDIESIDDVKYSFSPAEPRREGEFRKRFKKFLSDFRVKEVEILPEFDMLSSMKNSVMYDPTQKKTILMRDFWNSDIEATGPYFATRRVVPVQPGGTRDTGVGDPSTILKVKQLNMLARAISEKVPYSANAPRDMCNSRLRRVLKRNTFIHLDFKKFGLTFPRNLMNIAIEEIGKCLEIDTSHLIIRNFYLEIDGETYQTERGTVLGWLDSINSLCVSAILHWLSCEEELGFDFITFNDDVEISKFVSRDVPGTLELLRLAIVSELNSFDIPVSLEKTYGSKASVFLERYAFFGQYGLNMNKSSLTVKAYSRSLTTKYPWEAKLHHAAANQWYPSDELSDRCIKTCPIEFRLEEASLSLWSGGWFIYRGELDLSIVECDKLGYLTGLELSKFKKQNYSTRIEKTSTIVKINELVERKAYYAKCPILAREKWTDIPSLSDMNSDIELYREGLQTYLFRYGGRNEQFPLRVAWLTERSLSCDPGG